MGRRWRYAPHDSSLVSELTGKSGLPALLTELLVARGRTSLDGIRQFLEPKLSDLYEPDRLPGIAEAADRMTAAAQSGRRIVIYGDYDVDGVTAVSILWHCLRLLNARVDYYIPLRLEEGYGLNCEALRRISEDDPQTLVVTVDCGIASLEEAALARSLGLELIITDHHHFVEQLPAETLLCHPRLPDTDYPFGELCGAGVAFKLAWAICQRMGDGKKASPRMREFLIAATGLAAIGTVSDCVPLLDENRVLVKFGLQTLHQKASLGLKALMQSASVADKGLLQSEDVAFSLGPRLNAAGRLGHARLAVELLTTDNPERALMLAHYLDSQNKDRQTIERKILKQAKEMVQSRPDWESAAALVLDHPEWHPGVIGIVATRVADLFQKPAILVAVNREEQVGQGSGRSFGRFDLHAGLSACAEQLLSFGGHPAAAGLRVQVDRIEQFRQQFCQYVATNHLPLASDHELAIDAEVRLGDLTVASVKAIERMGPFGRGNPRPVLASTRVELAEAPRKMGEGGHHLGLQLKSSNGRLKAISFGNGDWADAINAAGGPIDICYQPQINHFRGRDSVELRLMDWKPSTSEYGQAGEPQPIKTVTAPICDGELQTVTPE